MKTGLELAEEGMQRALWAQESLNPGWAEEAHIALLSFVLQRLRHPLRAEETFTSEDVRSFVNGFFEPKEPRAWGGVFQRAAREGWIEKAGYSESKNPQAHCRPVALWRAKH